MEPKDIHAQTAQPESSEHEIRLEKVRTMNDEGIKPWPTYKPVSHTTAQAIALFKQTPEQSPIFELAGRLIIKRDHGKTFFGVIQDRDGRLQIYVKKDEVGESAFEHFKKYFDLGDIVWVKGPLFVTKTGEVTVKVSSCALLSKCLHPLPEKFHGLTDVEQRYRQRYLDLISNPESAAKFKKRSHIIQTARGFLQQRGFLEVETPMLHSIPGGAAARPFITHHNAYDMDLYLRIAPELYLKRLVVGGFERVFEINRNFRNEGVSTKHNPEFTMLEFYQAHGDYLVGMDTTEQLIGAVARENLPSLQVPFQEKIIDFTPPFKRLTVEQSLIEIGGLAKEEIQPDRINALIEQKSVAISPKASYGVKLFALFEHFVEPNIVQPTFIIGYPIEVSPLAKRDENNTNIAARFELFVCGMELANGFTELNDPFDQAERFKAQVNARKEGDQEAHHYDADYVQALEYALPPAVGVGMGIDRLTMLMTDTTSIKDVILFPTLKIAKE
ncbi:MAG: lysine--tRNA ligase [Candidatus Babeliales bacterium]